MLEAILYEKKKEEHDEEGMLLWRWMPFIVHVRYLICVRVRIFDARIRRNPIIIFRIIYLDINSSLIYFDFCLSSCICN